MPNAIDLLRANHDRLRQILPKLSDPAIAADERHRYLEAVEREVKIHSLVEEEIFYPEFKEAAKFTSEKDVYFQSIEEHHVVDMLLPEIKPLDAASDGFRAKTKVLRDLIEQHADHEERVMFRAAKQLLGDEKLNELGNRIEQRKIDLEEQWDSTIAGRIRQAQAVVDKFMPSSLKDLRGQIRR